MSTRRTRRKAGNGPRCLLSDPGLIEWRNALRYMKALDQFSKWAYTALTRAKTMVVFVQDHDVYRNHTPHHSNLGGLHDAPDATHR